MPGILLNSVLGLLPDRTRSVMSTETVTVVAPMYNEEEGARRCLASILTQNEAPEQIIVSINGGQDDTYAVVARILTDYGYRRRTVDEVNGLDASLERWLPVQAGAQVTLVVYRRQTAKADSINSLFRRRIVTTDRAILVDGDTILHPDFVHEIRRNFYRLRTRRNGDTVEHVIEDYGLVSGAVSSWAPKGAGRWQRIVSAGRKAEYAFSAMIRRGQTRQIGSSELFGNSRLFTVVGCGFAARRELFPMASHTRTEDHEFTLLTQSMPVTETQITPEALELMGLRVDSGEGLVSPIDWFDLGDKVILRTGGNARFVNEALMMTEDPDSATGYLNQVERWNGGGIEGALGRIGKRLPHNVFMTVWLSQLENIVGIMLLLFVLPSLVALNMGNPSIGMPWHALLGWFAFDVILSLLLNTGGFTLQRRATGMAVWPSLRQAFGLALTTLPSYLLIRYMNPFTWVAAAIDIIPQHLRSRRTRVARRPAGAWERPRFARMSLRTSGVMASVLAVFPLIVGFVVAPIINPVNSEGWRLTNDRPVVKLENHVSASPLYSSGPEEIICAPTGTWASAHDVSYRLHGDPANYGELNLWDLLTLARLAPLLPLIEEAAGTFDVPVKGYLQILINESLLDPLAHGPTGDLGLSQVTSDALTLLAAASQDPNSVIYSPGLIHDEGNVFDPAFSACLGAAKLAWAYSQPRVETLSEAYALYINPVHGFVNGRIGDIWVPLVAQVEVLAPTVERIAAVYARFETDPDSLTSLERRLVASSMDVRAGRIDIKTAYAQALDVIIDARIDDRDFYRRVLTNLYGAPTPSLAAAAASL